MIAWSGAGWFARAEAEAPQITRDWVQTRAEAERAVWLDRLPASRPRLFFREGEFAGLRSRYEKATGRERALFDEAIAAARKAAKEPIPAYKTPEELVRPPNFTLFAAQEENWMRSLGDSMVGLSFAALLVDEPGFREQLRKLVLAACAYPHWGARPQNGALAAGHVSRGIAIAYDWHPELWSEADKKLIRETIRERVGMLNSGFYARGSWASHPENNHNHVSAAGPGLCGVAFLGEIPEAEEWTAAALTNFEHVVRYSSADGSTPEGIPYWSYGVSFIFQYIEGVDPVLRTRRLHAEPFLKNIPTFRLHSSTSGFAGALIYGDAPPRDYNGPHHFLHRLAAQNRDSAAQYLAATLPFPTQGGPDCKAFAALWYDPAVPASAPATLDHHQSETDIVTMRSGWTNRDYLLAMKSGLTNLNHGHLDVGALTWAFGSDWLINSPGYGSGFGNPAFWQRNGPRWTYFSNATESQATLLVNGANQLFAPESRGTVDSFVSGVNWSWASTDLAGAYADVKTARRSLLHRRGDYVLVWDTVTADAPVTVEWLAQTPPIARTDKASLVMEGIVGDLELRPLVPAKAAFAPRAPTSPNIDVKEAKLKTSTLSQKGKQVEYVVALLPTFLGAVQTAKDFRVEEIHGGRRLTITGTDWTDRVFFPAPDRAAPSEGVVVFDDDFAARAENVRSFGFKARVVAARFVKGEPDSCLLIAARKFGVDGGTLMFSRPVDLSVQSAPGGAWIVDLGGDTALEEVLPESGWSLRRLDDGAVTGKTADLTAGRYVFAAGGPDLAALRAWIADLPRSNAAPASVSRLPAAPASARVAVEAEAFDYERGGELEIVEKIGASAGKGVKNFGNKTPLHVVGWTVDVKQAGAYVLNLRYCTGVETFTLEGMVDGRSLSPEPITLPGTKGWSNTADNWEDRVLAGADGKPLTISLEKGRHKLRLLSPSGALNLDRLELRGAASAGR